MKITKLTKSQRVPDRWYMDTEDGESLAVTLNLIADYSLYTGRELTGEELAALRGDAAKAATKARAFRMLEAKRLSKKELTDRLLKKGETEENARETVEYMEDLGAVNDEDYARAIVEHYSARGYGAGRMKDELYKRGIPRELWQGALESLPEDTDALDALIKKRLAGHEDDPKALKRVTDMLLRRGYNWGEVKNALSRYELFLQETENSEDF